MDGTQVVIPYAPRPLQAELHATLGRFNVLVCHRRFGKTVFCINELLRGAALCKRPNPRFAYIAPLYKQAKTVAWDYLKHYTAPIPGRTVNESELRVDIPGGRRISLYGADNPDSLRGIYLDGVVMDEYAQMSPRMWKEVIRPALSDRKGWAIFIGTPKGHNEFWERYDFACRDDDWFAAMYKASKTNVLDEDELEAALREMGEDEYAQEYECSFTAAIQGAYYGKLMAQADEDGRISQVPHDPAVRVETWWDLGVRDPTAIWFAQRVGQEVHVIDYYEATGEGLAHYVSLLDEYGKPRERGGRGYKYDTHYFPHDVKARELGTGKTRIEMLAELQMEVSVVADHRVMDGINAARNLLTSCWFDAERCAHGIECLRQYRCEFDDVRRAYRATPYHDWTSHGADAFRYGAMSVQFEDFDSDWGDIDADEDRSEVSGY